MAEWLKAHAWKACLGETLTWVRIPLSPPKQRPKSSKNVHKNKKIDDAHRPVSPTDEGTLLAAILRSLVVSPPLHPCRQVCRTLRHRPHRVPEYRWMAREAASG